MTKNLLLLLFLFTTLTANAQITWVEAPSDQFIDCNDPGSIQENISNYLLSITATTVDSNCDALDISNDFDENSLITCDENIMIEIIVNDQCSNTLSALIMIIITDSLAPEWIGDEDDYLPEDIEIIISTNATEYTFPNGYFESSASGDAWPIYPPMEGSEFEDQCNNVHFRQEGAPPFETFALGIHTIKYILDDGCNLTIHEFTVTIKSDFCQVDVCTESCATLPNCHLCNIESNQEIESCLPAFNGDILDWPLELCNGAGVPHNMSWYSFVAGDSTLFFLIDPFDCSVTTGAIGMQAGVYDFCRDENGQCIGGDANCSNGLDEIEFSITDLIIGQTYYLFVDGCNGAQCKFILNIEGLDVGSEGELGEDACPSEVISFNYFIDSNENGTKDISEYFVNLQSINDFILIEPQAVISNLYNDSEFHLVDEGTYNLTFINEYFIPTNVPSSIEVLEDQGIVDYEFGLIGNNANPISISNLEITASSIEICNQTVTYSFWILNSGNQVINDEVTLQFDPLFQFVEADQDAVLLTDTTVTWQTGDLLPLESTTINVQFDLPNESNTGDVFCLTPSSTFSNSNNNIPYCFELRCSYDPNDKHGVPFRGGENYTLFDETLKYTIRFENLGNFYAKDVRIEDKLSSHLDYSTLKLLQSSHDVDRLWINRDGVLKIFFDDINLPSIEMDSILNKGFVQFSIEQKPGLNENTILENKASIFFDKNTPIITNTTSHNLVSMLPILDATNNFEIANDLLIYPNPGSSVLYIDSSIDLYELKSIRILNTKGQSIIKHDLNSHSINVQSLDKGLYIVESTSRNGKIRIAKYIKL